MRYGFVVFFGPLRIWCLRLRGRLLLLLAKRFGIRTRWISSCGVEMDCYEWRGQTYVEMVR